jgi:hypothetical protein
VNDKVEAEAFVEARSLVKELQELRVLAAQMASMLRLVSFSLEIGSQGQAEAALLVDKYDTYWRSV